MSGETGSFFARSEEFVCPDGTIILADFFTNEDDDDENEEDATEGQGSPPQEVLLPEQASSK